MIIWQWSTFWATLCVYYRPNRRWIAAGWCPKMYSRRGDLQCIGILRQSRTIRRLVSQSISVFRRSFGSDEAWLWKHYAGRHSFYSLNWTACGRQWMQRLDLSSRQVAMIVSLRYSAACTRFVCHSAYLSYLSWYTSASVDLDRPTWPTPFSWSPGFPVDTACGHRRRRHYTTVHCRWPSVSRRRGTNMEQFDRPKWPHQILCKPSKPNENLIYSWRRFHSF